MTDKKQDMECGPDGYGWLVPEGPKGLFTEPCRAHDKKYKAGGTERDRIRADWGLFKDCARSVRGEGFWTRWSGRFLAFIYLLGVTTIGWIFFSYEDQTK